jgi:hypothetical protein
VLCADSVRPSGQPQVCVSAAQRPVLVLCTDGGSPVGPKTVCFLTGP